MRDRLVNIYYGDEGGIKEGVDVGIWPFLGLLIAYLRIFYIYNIILTYIGGFTKFVFIIYIFVWNFNDFG